MGFVKLAQKAGVARTYKSTQFGPRANHATSQHRGAGTWALKPNSKRVITNIKTGEPVDVKVTGGGLTGKGKGAVAGAAVGTTGAAGGTAYGVKRKKSETVTKSAFGVEHSVSKAFGGSILGQARKVDHGVGAGQMVSSKLARPSASVSPTNYSGNRLKAKKEGKRAARQFRQLGTPKGYGGYESAHPGVESANTGWAARGASHSALAKPAGKAPAGMRGNITSRVQTSAMRERDRNFI